MGSYRLALHWFRRDLRLTDNRALQAAHQEAAAVLPVYVVSAWNSSHAWTGAPRQEFLCGSLAALEKNICAAGGKLLFRRGNAVEVLAQLLDESRADALYFNRDPGEPYGLSTDHAVRDLCRRRSVACHDHKDVVLHEAAEVVNADGNPYRVFTPYARQWNCRPKPAPVPRVTRFTPLPREVDCIPSDPCPTLATWRLTPSGVDILQPGERAARDRMKHAVSFILPQYGENRNLPYRQTTSRLSQDLRFGLISIRELYARARQAEDSVTMASHKTGIRTFIKELAWREFYFAVLSHFPEVFDHEFNPQWRGLAWSYDESAFERWKAGQTGFPIIDAGMRQLNATGFMHNRLRMITAMFLTKDLHLDWRLGERYFMQRLVDGESAANNGGWQWSAGTGADAAPYFRIQNPWSQTRRYDAEGLYIKQWCPELRDVPPARFALDPGTTPASAIAPGYPPPMVNHAEERLRTLALFNHHRQQQTAH